MVDELQALVKAVLSTPKYQSVAGDVVRAIGERELAKRHSWKEGVKAAKRKLHQVGGAYLVGAPDYGHWLAEMSSAVSDGDRTRLLSVCRQAMLQHSSTRERLVILDQFFSRTLGSLPRIKSVIDIACGLNPLAIPWMPLASDVRYDAYDIYVDMVGFLNRFMGLVGIGGCAYAQDVTRSPPPQQADLALILKSLPCIEQLQPGGSERLLEALRADILLVSFPVRSLGGKVKGMAQSYERRFRQLVAGRGWAVKRLEFSNELAFLVRK